MADIVVIPDRVARVFPRNDIAYSAVAAVAITAGAIVYFNTAGKLVLSDASAAGTALVAGMAIDTAAAGQSTTLLVRGLVAGFTLTSQAYMAALFLSDTNTGIMADAAGTVSVALGRVWAMSDPSYGKVVYFSAPGL